MSRESRRRSSPKEGRKFRFVVQSAEEAVKVIREQLGENARVLSVEQVGGKGLAKFLSSPQLEVIATIPTKEELEKEKADKLNQSGGGEEEGKPGRRGRTRRSGRRAGAREAAAAAKPAAAPAVQPQQQVPAQAQPAVPQPQQAALPAEAAKERQPDTPLTPSGKETLESILKKANFDEELLGRMERETDWAKFSKMELKHGLSEIFYWLKKEYSKVPVTELAPRIAFMGTPGCGKTTALCKRMAHDVIVEGKQIQVLKVEGETPNPDDSLRVLCNILNVELLRDPVDLDRVQTDGYLYVDVPGIPLNERKQWDSLSQRLDELWVDSRVLVLNAAYEREILKGTIGAASEMGCTHQVFTHLDELPNATKLWNFILGSNLSTLFFSYGQNATSEFSADILGFLSSRTFPSYLTM